MALLDALIYGVRHVFNSSGTELPQRSRIKFAGTVTDDPVNDWTYVESTGGGAPSGAAGGGLSGTYPNPALVLDYAGNTGKVPIARGGTNLSALGTALQVLRVNAGATALEYAAAAAGGSTPTGTGLRKIVAGVEDAAASLLVDVNVDAAAAIAITKLAAGTSGQYLVNVGTTPTWVTAAGDWSGSVSANVVAKINGTSVNAGGALTTGHVLTATGVSSATWQANNALVTWATDLAGSSISSQIVVALTGASSKTIIRSTSATLEWEKATGASALRHAAQTTDVATSGLTVQAQGAFTTAATNLIGGYATVASGQGAGATIVAASPRHGEIQFSLGNLSYVRVGYNSARTESGFYFTALDSTLPGIGNTRVIDFDAPTAIGAGMGLTLRAQAGYAGAYAGGALSLRGGVSGGAAADGAVTISTGSTQVVSYTAGTTLPVVYGPSAADCIESSRYTAATTTTALQTIATITLTASVVTQVFVTIVGRQGTNYTTGTLSRTYYNAAGVITADDAAGDTATATGKTAAGTAFTASNFRLTPGTGNVAVQVTPWTTTSTSWTVHVQVVRL